MQTIQLSNLLSLTEGLTFLGTLVRRAFPSLGGFGHPRVSTDRAQSTAILGSGGKVDFLRRFCIKFQFFQIIPETARRQDSANSLYLCAPYPTQNLKTSTEERGEAVWGPASRFTGHLAHYTQSRHLIALQRIAAQSPK